MLRVAVIVSVLAFMFAGQGLAISFQEIPCADLPSTAVIADSAPKLIAGPYLSKMSANSVTIMWQSDAPSIDRIVVFNGKSTAEYTTTKAARLDAIRVKGLSPNTRYSYRLWVSNPQKISSGPASDSFITFPAKPRPVSFIVYGDTRSNPDRHAQVINAMSREKGIDFVLHSGDLVRDGRNLDLWVPGYFTPGHAMMGRVPFYPVVGNHDGGDYFYQLLGIPKSERWYSFDLPGIHVIALDSMDSFDTGSDQYKWLVADLERHKDAKWKFIVMHSPVYTSGPHGAMDADGVPKETAIRTAQKLFPVLAAKYGIRAVFSGHDHSYERSERDGVDYIVSGGGGAENYSEVNAKTNPYRKFFFSGLHYCVITVDGAKGRLVAKTPDGKILDRAEL